jgi:hypothetical protein
VTYSPTDQLHRRFRFPKVLGYSLICTDAIYRVSTQILWLLRFMFTGEARVANLRRHIERRQCRYGYNQDGWFRRVFTKARLLSELFVLSLIKEPLLRKVFMKTQGSTRSCFAFIYWSQFIPPINRGTSCSIELNQPAIAEKVFICSYQLCKNLASLNGRNA